MVWPNLLADPHHAAGISAENLKCHLVEGTGGHVSEPDDPDEVGDSLESSVVLCASISLPLGCDVSADAVSEGH
jgi:hypothetical protein